MQDNLTKRARQLRNERITDFFFSAFIFTMISCIAVIFVAMTIAIVREVM